MRIVGIQIATCAGALAHLAEGQLAQATDFTHDHTIECALEQPRLLAVIEIGELFGLHQFGGDPFGWLRMGQRRLSAKDRTAMLADPVDMPTHQLGSLHGRTATALFELFGADQRTNAETDPTLARRHRFARQHRRTQRLGQHRQAIEHCRIACSDMHRQYRRLAPQRYPRKAIRPAPVAHSSSTHPRHFASGKHDQRLTVVQSAVDATQTRCRAVAKHIHRQQQLAQLRHHRQPVIAKNAHIAAHRAHQLQ